MGALSKERVFMPVPTLVAALDAIICFRRDSALPASSTALQNNILFHSMLKNILFLPKFLKEDLTGIKGS